MDAKMFDLCFVIMCIYFGLYAHEWFIIHLLTIRGVDCVGTVMRTFTRYNRSTSYFVVFDYLVQRNTIYTFKQFISKTTFEAFGGSDPVLVRYLPNNPRKARLWGATKDNSYLHGMLGMTILMGGITIVIYLSAVNKP